MRTDEGGYPVHWEADVVLRDGAAAHVRPIRPEDAERLQAFHVGQSERSTYLRFFAPMARLSESDLVRFTTVDHRDRVALVAVSGQDESERILAVGRFDAAGAGTAEIAFNVADTEHGRGLGTVLLEHLAAAARERGISRFAADVLPQNAAMLAVFREAGYAVSQRLDDGVITVVLDIDPTERSRAVMADREHRAEARSVEALLTARRVLVVAEASNGPVPSAGDPLVLAAAVLDRLAASGTEVHLVGPPDLAAPGALRHAGLADVPPVDLLVLAVPPERAEPVVRAAAGLRPRTVVVLSGGFAETGTEGLAHQRALLRTAHAAGMRLLGPATYGLWRAPSETAPALDLSLAPVAPAPGGLALNCQSAPMAVGLLASAGRRGLGLSTFVSSGNRTDLSGNDVMQFCAVDAATDVVGLYLESIGNPRKFARVVRRLATAKPVVVFTAGRTGHVVPAGHVLPTTKVPRRVLDDLLRRSGAIRVTSQHQLLDVAQLLVSQPLPTGRRVAVLASSESLGSVVAEAAASAGLEVVGSDILPTSPEAVHAAVAGVDADALVVVDVPTVGPCPPERVRAVAEAAAAGGRTTVACLLGLSGLTDDLTAPGPGGARVTVPAFTAPEDGVLALAAAVRYATWRTGDRGLVVDPPGIDREAARALVEAAMADLPTAASRPLPPDLTARLLGHYGIALWDTRRVDTVEEALAAADALGWPVALKSSAGHLRHRMDLGAVRLDLSGPPALVDAWEQLRERLTPIGAGNLPLEVQAMAQAGVACVVRSSEDERFGPVVSFGLAGDATDLLDDVAYGVAPLSGTDVAAMIRGVRAAPRLFGYRGTPEVDVAALEDVLTRVAALADDLPEVRRLELHPVVVAPGGLAVLGASVELAHVGTRSDGLRRTLPR